MEDQLTMAYRLGQAQAFNKYARTFTPQELALYERQNAIRQDRGASKRTNQALALGLTGGAGYGAYKAVGGMSGLEHALAAGQTARWDAVGAAKDPGKLMAQHVNKTVPLKSRAGLAGAEGKGIAKNLWSSGKHNIGAGARNLSSVYKNKGLGSALKHVGGSPLGKALAVAGGTALAWKGLSGLSNAISPYD